MSSPMKHSHSHLIMTHIRRIGLRAIAASVLLWLFVSFPFPLLPVQYFLLVQLPLSIFLFMVYIGKLLFDTFFYDRYGQ